MKWHETKQGLEKVMIFDDQTQLANFVLELAKVSDQKQHHADMEIKYNQLTIHLISHDVKKITERDYGLAAKADELYAEFGQATE